eukprot:TRINITY_DN8250_c1_g1_i5.p2 TRINITY_DN8250_c1_g1~~TRINITY_DN8250_c1_g1_i5.p2  ORF type:complete len:471 (-),score=86.62 TRINITY_DN8250_c1_g1_i5:1965-3377(-)
MLPLQKLVLFFICILITVDQINSQSKQVAIIGAGIGGACTAHFLKKLTQNQVEIQVFEKSDRIGGRVWSFEYGGKNFELGAILIYKENKYILDLAKEMGLNVKPYSDPADPVMRGFHSGEEFVFQQGEDNKANLQNLIGRYGQAPLIFPKHVIKMMNRLTSIYQLQENWTTFESPVDLLKAQKLYEFTQQSFREFYNEHMSRFPSPEDDTYLEEILGAINGVIYNTNNDLNALAGIAANSMLASDVQYVIEGGDQQLPQKLLQNTNVQLNSQVKQIIQNTDGKYEIFLDEGNNFGPFDAVVISTPLTLTKIDIQLSEGKKLPNIPLMEFQNFTVSFFKGHLKSSAFGIEGGLPVDLLLTTEKAESFFRGLVYKMKLSDDSTLYKIYSPDPMTKEQLEILFEEGVEVVKEMDWLAFPRFIPPTNFSPFVLAPGLFYGSTYEAPASGMELSAISAKNSALLVAKQLEFEFQG